MNVLSDLRGLSSAEEIFVYLSVPFEPRVMNVARLHILRRMGEYLDKLPVGELDEAAQKERCRAYLTAAYGDFVRRSPLDERVFKVHKDAARPKAEPGAAFVPLSALQSKREEV